MIRGFGLLVLLGAAFWPVWGWGQPAAGDATKLPPPPPAPDLRRGRELAEKYCAACHLMPEPDVLTKSAWAHQIQPEMAKWLGLQRVDYEGMTDGKLLEEAAVFPPSPIVPEEDWFAIWDYYRAAAPSRLSMPVRPAPTVG